MKKHLILIDLDSTLLDDRKRISDFNKEMLKKVQELGHEVIIATGRAHYRSHKFYKELKLRTLMVNRNASHIHLPVDKEYKHYIEWIDSNTVSALINSEIIDTIEEMYVENMNNVYVIKGEKDFYLSYPICNVIDFNKHSLEDCTNLITISVKNEHIDKLKEMLAQYQSIKYELFRYGKHITIIQIYPVKSDKTNAYQLLSKHYDIPQERIMAIGDGSNDINMIKNAGIGVAMKNAIDEVKKNAKIITTHSNNESGVGIFLKEYFKI